ncbi:hypothetical protein ACHWQZ_G017818 [Mnemiopsis leidyi]
MLAWIVTFLLIISCPCCVESQAGQDSDEDFLMWKTVNDRSGLISVYENVDLQASSFLAVCLGHQFNRDIVNDGQVILETSSSDSSTVFEWKSYFDLNDYAQSYSRLQCFDHDDSTCYTTEESKCSDGTYTDPQYLSFGHCQEDMSMIISSDSFKISCGDQVVEAKRCPEGETTEPEMFKITVKEFINGVCATRVRPIESGWIDLLSGNNIDRTIDLKSHSLIIHQLMIRERHSDSTQFSVNFSAVGPDSTNVMVVNLESSGPYIYKTDVTISAIVCGSSTDSKEFYVGKELGKTQIEITLVGDQIAIIAYDSASGKSGEILLPSCDQLNDELTMSFEDSTSKRSLSLIGNTNVRIIQKGNCSEPNVTQFNLRISETYDLRIGSMVKVGCKDPTYEIIGNDKITCQRNKTWTPQPFPECERKTCGQELYLTKDGQCKACPDGDCSITNSKSICTEENLKQQGLKIANSAISHVLGEEVDVVCEDLMKEITGNKKVHCDLTIDEKLELRQFPICEKKKCDSGKFLAFNGSCLGSICPKGQFAGEGSGECLACKSRGDKFYSDTIGSADCKSCDGEVDSGRTFCLQRDPNSQPPSQDSESSSKLYLYITMAVVAVLVHALAFGAGKWQQVRNSRNRCGPEYFAKRFKKYNSTYNRSLRVFGKKQHEISIQYEFPEALLVLEGQKLKEQEEEKEVVEDGAGSADGGFDDRNKYNHLNADQNDNVDPGPLYEDMTCSSTGQNETNTQSDEPTYLGISEIPFPGTEDDQPTGYEDVSVMPLPSNIDSVIADRKYSSLRREGNDNGEASKSSAVKTKKTFKDIALSTLKKDGTMKKDLTKKKSASVGKKDDTLRRNTIKKADMTACTITAEGGVERYKASNEDGTETVNATYTKVTISTRQK